MQENQTETNIAPTDATCNESTLGHAREVALSKFQQAREFAANKVSQIRKAAAQQAESLREYTVEKGTIACDKAKAIHKAGEDYVKAKPTQSVLIALGVGVVIGLLIRGRR